MKAGKWNYKTKKYDDYELPKKTFLFSDNMEEETQCASCGETIIFGKSYTSREIHNTVGLGYPVCDDCYEKEMLNSQFN